jgi:hypothetical protein
MSAFVSKLRLPAFTTGAVLILAGIVSGSAGLAILAAAVVAAAFLGLRRALAVRRACMDARALGRDGWTAFEEGLAAMMPRRFARIAAAEAEAGALLFQWATRRIPRGPDSFPYTARCLLAAMFGVAAVALPAEAAVAHFLVPWVWLKWLVFASGAYAVLWVAGLYASVIVKPHRVGPEGVRVGYGLLAQGFIPYRSIISVQRKKRPAPGGGDGLKLDADSRTAWLSVGGETDIILWLWSPVRIRRLFSETGLIHTVYLAVDDPAGFAKAIEARLPRVSPA